MQMGVPPESPSRLKVVGYFFVAVFVNSAAAILLIPPPRSELVTYVKPGAPFFLAACCYAGYLILVPRYLPKYWTSFSVSLANAICIAAWAYVVWKIG
jgi:hypothetical protein